MAPPVKHFSLHRIAGTELRVVSDVETGVLPVIAAEESVIRSYAASPSWEHRWVTLFVLHDLSPLSRQLQATADGADELANRVVGHPVLTVYDLTNPARCNVFVNCEAMKAAGYWNDPVATRALLAHEHAHPLSENDTIKASRGRAIQLRLKDEELPAISPAHTMVKVWERTGDLLGVLFEKLVLTGPREVFTNELAIRSGFGDALLHLNKCNLDTMEKSLVGREEVRCLLEEEVMRGTLSPAEADLLQLIGDLNSYLDVVLEVVPFLRAGRDDAAQELEEMLARSIFPRLTRETTDVYHELRRQYTLLRCDQSPHHFTVWGDRAADCLRRALARKGLDLRVEWKVRHD